MITFQKNKKKFLLTEKGIKKIKEDIDGLSKLPIGIYAKTKEFDFAYYVKIIINKNNICLDSSNKNYTLLPDAITFLISRFERLLLYAFIVLCFKLPIESL